MKKSEVLEFFGNSPTTVARFLGIKQSSVSEWHELIPEISARRLHAYTHERAVMRDFFPTDYRERGVLIFDPSLYGAAA